MSKLNIEEAKTTLDAVAKNPKAVIAVLQREQILNYFAKYIASVGISKSLLTEELFPILLSGFIATCPTTASFLVAGEAYRTRNFSALFNQLKRHVIIH